MADNLHAAGLVLPRDCAVQWQLAVALWVHDAVDPAGLFSSRAATNHEVHGAVADFLELVDNALHGLLCGLHLRAALAQLPLDGAHFLHDVLELVKQRQLIICNSTEEEQTKRGGEEGWGGRGR